MKPHRNQKTGSRYLYEPFIAPDPHAILLERLLEEKSDVINKHLERIDDQISNLDRRLWIAFSGVVIVLLTEAIIEIVAYAGQ